MKTMLNLGCGSRYHPDWINVDLNPTSKEIISHDLTKPLPFYDDYFDIVYHSHVLEHLDRQEGEKFLKECYRLCKNDGVIRIAVPDLEMIVRLYLYYLENAINGTSGADIRYDWMMLELCDQMVRTATGGEMQQFLTNQNHSLDVIQFIESRAWNINQCKTKETKCILSKLTKNIFNYQIVYNILCRICIKGVIFLCYGRKGLKVADEILFRLQGEVHRWMYDQYSLSRALAKVGFSDITICSPNESRIAGWADYELEVDRGGAVLKPDSLICEAVK